MPFDPSSKRPRQRTASSAATSRISRKEAMPMLDLCRMYVKELRLEEGLDATIVRSAWDQASGASSHTLSSTFHNGTLIVELSSSLVRSRLSPQRDALLLKINQIVYSDPLFSRNRESDPCPVKALILR